MRDYVIMTDSCCDLNQYEVMDCGLTVLPLTFTMDGVTRRDLPDHGDMTPAEFYRHMRAGVECTTAAVNIAEFESEMRKAISQGWDVLCICFSSALSTTYQSACVAAKELCGDFPDARIEVIDSLSASRGQGMLVWHAAKMKQRGKSLDEVADWVRGMIQHQDHWFTVADLHHLRRGGRLNAPKAFIGAMLSIKPVMHTDKEGKLTPVEKARGMKRALNRLVDKVGELGIAPLEEQDMFICHADAPESVDYVKKLLYERFGVTKVHADYIGPVIGAHTGAGTLGLFFFGRER